MLSKFSVKSPYTVVVGVIIVLILGVVAFMGMQVDLLPNINLPYAVVITSYTGASPEEVEIVVTKPLEQAMATVSNIKNVTSVSSENMSMVALEFDQETDMNTASNEMREKIDMVEPLWDDDNIGSPMIMQLNPDMMPVVIASVDMEDKDAAALSALVNDTLLSQFESIEGVASVTAIGMTENRINVTIDDDLIDEINEVIAASIDGDIGKAKRMLASARSQVQAGYSALDSAKSQGEAQLDAAESQIAAGLDQLEKTEAELKAAVAAAEKEKETLDGELATLESQKTTLETKIKGYTDKGETVPAELTAELATVKDKIEAKKAEVEAAAAALTEAQSALAEVQGQIQALKGQQAEVDAGREQLDAQLGTAKSQLDSGMAQINAQSAKLSSAAASAKKKADIKEYITKDMIAGILTAQNFAMPAGTLETEDDTYSVKVGKDLTSLEDIGNIFLFELDIDGVDDIRIKDVATVETAGIDEGSYAKVNGRNGILLTFQKQSNYATTDVADNIKDAMAKMEKDNPGLNCYSFMDQGEYIRLIINSVVQNLLLGAILAIIILFLCLKDIRPTLIVAVSIPASVLFALVMMYFTGVTMNLISMSGLALGVGMLVDNSIVVIENIYRMRREGASAKEAAVSGAKQVSGAITASTLTTISVFVPLLFTSGLSKELFMDMGLTIAFSLIASLIVALTVVPSMASRVLRNETDKDNRVFEWLKIKYEGLLTKTLKKRKLTIALICLLLVVSAVLSCTRGFSFMPSYDSPQVTATLTTENEEMSDADFYAAADAVTEAALADEGVEAIGSMSSEMANSFGSMGGGSDIQSVSMYIMLNEKNPADHKKLEKELQQVSEKHGCDIELVSSTDMMSYLGGTGVTLTVKGEDLSEMSGFTQQLSDDLAQIDGVAEVSSDMENPTSQLMITVDKDKAMKKKLTVAQVYQTVAQGIAADNAATTITMNGSEYSVFVVDGEDKMTIDDVENLEINDKTEVGDIAEVTVEDSPSSIYRTDQQRYMTITATVNENAVTSSVSADVEKMVKEYDTPAGISVEVGGESVEVSKYITDLVKAIALALVLMYLIMVAQFQSLRSPFIVMFTVPLAFTGGFLALFICGFDISVIALLGFLVLCGVVVNNGIVLVDYINQLVAQGMEINEALILAGKTRLRPIIMTASTTILALITMAFGIGSGTEMVQPMAIVAIGGLLYATLMTLFFVPLMYDLIHGKRFRKKAALAASSGVPADEEITEAEEEKADE